jgi:apolipoprotein D and lipocalin family protein
MKDLKKIYYLLSLCMISLFGCRSYPDLEVVPNVDLNKYIGKWYEIAAFPQSFQKGCYCSTAEYILSGEDYIKVINTCRKNGINGEIKQATGKAFIVPNSNNAKLEVQFFWPFKGDYWIIDLADDYSYAVVGHKNREYLWILSRLPKMDEKIYEDVLSRVKAKGFDLSKLKKTVQDCH